MPYIAQKGRWKMDSAVALFDDKEKWTEGVLATVLFTYCDKEVVPSYNNYKNFCGELEQCATEVERRHDMPFCPSFTESNHRNFNALGLLQRGDAEKLIRGIKAAEVQVNGDLNYLLYKFHLRYSHSVRQLRLFCDELRFCVRKIQELLLAPYEDLRRAEQGDVV